MDIRNLTSNSFSHWKDLLNAKFWDTSVFGHRSSDPITKENKPTGRKANNHISYFLHIHLCDISKSNQRNDAV
jgi:hypothetical protein